MKRAWIFEALFLFSFNRKSSLLRAIRILALSVKLLAGTIHHLMIAIERVAFGRC